MYRSALHTYGTVWIGLLVFWYVFHGMERMWAPVSDPFFASQAYHNYHIISWHSYLYFYIFYIHFLYSLSIVQEFTVYIRI